MEYKVGDLCIFQEGYVNPSQKIEKYFGGPHKWVRAVDVNNNEIFNTSRTLSEEGFKSAKKSAYKFPANSIVITKSGTIGRVAIIKDEMAGNRATINIVPNEKLVNLYYLFYLLITKRQDLENLAVGSVQKNLYISVLSTLKINVPELKKQNKIAKVLKNIDDKIVSNRQIIANLEELSQTLFKRWFIDFEFPDKNGTPYKSNGGEMIDSELGEIPIDWKVSKIIELDAIVSDHVANGSFKKLKENVEFVNADIKNNAIFVRNIDLKKQDFRPEKYVSDETYKFLKKTQLHGRELIISNVGDVGSVHLCPKVDKNMVLGNNQIFLKHNIDKKWNYYLYLYFKSDVGKQLINKITSGSVQMKFNKTDFRNLQIVIPTQKILDYKFGDIIDFLNLIEEKKYENKRLIELRDTLLPKLMSGELEIPDDIEVNADELSI